MPPRARVVIAAMGLALFLFVLERIRRRQMRIEYSLMWFVISVGALLLALMPDVFDRLARTLGIDYPPALYFLVAVLCMFFILLHVSAELTRLREQNKNLIQEVSILREAVEAPTRERTPSADRTS
jgi:hypothetical protein